MSEDFDHLSIEELQSQLFQIQQRIQEKEKQQVIEKIADLLKTRDPAYVKTVLSYVEGKKFPEVREKSPPPPPAPREEEKPKKEGAYLRNGKVFFGIQEIKFTKYDKNHVLRISKEGKGLPPRVDAFPDDIRDALLALPVRSDSTIPPSLSDLETVVDDRCQPDSTGSEPEPIVEALSAIVVVVQPEPLMDAPPEPAAPVALESLPPIEPPREPEPEPIAQETEPATVYLEVPLDADEGETRAALPEPPPPLPSRTGRKSAASKADATPRVKPEPLQASLF